MRIRKVMGIVILCTFLMGGLVVKGKVGPSERFTDVSSGIWYESTLEFVLEQEIIDGYPDGTFRGTNEMKRDQFIKTMVVAIDGVQPNAEGYWAQNYIDKAIELGLISEGQFGDYGQMVTRAEMAGIAEKAIAYKEGAKNYQYASELEGKIVDLASVKASGYKDAILHMYEIGVLTGYPSGEYKADAGLKRQEAITVIARVVSNAYRKAYEPMGYIGQFPERIQELSEELGFVPYRTREGVIYTPEDLLAHMTETRRSTYMDGGFEITVVEPEPYNTEREWAFGITTDLRWIYQQEKPEECLEYMEYMIGRHLSDITEVSSEDIKKITDRLVFRYDAFVTFQKTMRTDNEINPGWVKNVVVVYDPYGRQLAFIDKGMRGADSIIHIRGLHYTRYTQ